MYFTLKTLAISIVFTCFTSNVYGAPITIFSADGTSPSSPWDNIMGVSPSDIQQGVTAGDVFSLFPTVDGPEAQIDFIASGVDPNTTGTIIKLGGFSDSGTAGVAQPLKLSATRFLNDLDLTVNINFTIDTPAFEDVIYWFDNISLMLDQDANNDGIPDDNAMLWFEWKLASKYVARSKGVGNWLKQATALLNGNEEVNIKQIKKYEKQGKLEKVWFLEPEIVAHPLIPATDLQGGVLDIDLSLIDITSVPEPHQWYSFITGLICMYVLRRRNNLLRAKEIKSNHELCNRL